MKTAKTRQCPYASFFYAITSGIPQPPVLRVKGQAKLELSS